MNLLRVFLVLSTTLLGLLNTSSTQQPASQEKGQPLVSTMQPMAGAPSTARPTGSAVDAHQAVHWKYDAQTGQFTGLIDPSPELQGQDASSNQVSTSDLGPNDEQEPNETPAQANPLPIPGLRTGHAAVGDAFAISVVFTGGGVDRVHDLFAVTVAPNSNLFLTLNFTNPAADLDLFLFGAPVGNQVPILSSSTNPGSASEQIATNLPAGTYYVGVSASSGGSDYTLLASDGNSCVYAISPSNKTFSANGGASNIQVTTQNGCAWTAVSNNPGFITINSGSNGTGSGTVNYSVAVNNGASRSGTITVAGQTFTVNQSAAGCSFNISPNGQGFGPGGGSDSISVMAGAGCLWTAVSNNSWIFITSGSSGNGNGTVNYSVGMNFGPDRIGSITVAGQTFIVVQAGSGGGGQATLLVDDGSFELATGIAGGGTSYRVNRLTPPSYPATLTSVLIFFGAFTGVSPGNPFTVIVGTDPSGNPNIDGLSFQSTPAMIQGLNQFNTYNVPNVTINSGDFVVGMIFTNAPGSNPFILDTTPPSQQRSYRSVDGGNNFDLVNGNYAIRAEVTLGQNNNTCPAVANINPTNGAVGSNVTITGTGFTGVNSVKFFNNVAASFMVVNDTTITATVPSGAVSGPITISEVNCVNAQTANFTVNINNSCVPVSISNALTGSPGSSVTVPITVGDLTGKGVTAYQFTLTFNQAVVTPSSTPVSKTGTLSNGFTVTANAATPGQLTVSAFGITPLTGTGTLLNLNFDLIGAAGACSNLTWTSFVFNEGTPCATTANGSICLTSASISGAVNYGTSPQPKPVPGATLTAAGTPSATSTTNNAGAYTLAGLGSGPYTVTPAKTGDVNGIGALDASMVAQHVAGLITLSANQQIAGDASGNGSLSAFDASLIAQTAAGIPNNGIAGTWKFVPGSRSYPTLSGNLANQNFDAILVGDVTGNWMPPPPVVSPPNSQPNSQLAAPLDVTAQSTVSLPSVSGAHGATITIPITASDLTGLGVTAYDFVLIFDQSVLQLQGTPTDSASTLSNGWSIIANAATPGKLTVSAFNATATTGLGTLLNLKFNITGAPGKTTALTLQSFTFNEGTPTVMTANGNFAVNNPSPTLSNLSPNSATAGGANFTLTVNGANFVSGSKVRWNGGERTTTFMGDTKLTAAITAADIAAAGTASVTVFNPTPGGGLSNALNFTITAPPLARTLRVVNKNAAQGASVVIEMDAQGNENALQFSLSFDPALLTFSEAVHGKDFGNNGTLTVNKSLAAQGKVGFLLVLNAGQTFSAGKRELLVLTFKTTGAETQQTATISFGDAPLSRLIGGVNASTLPADYISGSVTIAPGFEGDVSPAPNGNNKVDIFDFQRVMRFAAKLENPASPSEFQRADCAPKDPNKGDGLINVFDVQQAARYAAKLDPLVTVGGPTGPPTTANTRTALTGAAAVEAESARQLRLVPTVFQRGQTNALRLELDAQGNENALGFSLNYDPAVLRFAEATVDDALSGAMLLVNSNDLAHGHVGILFALPTGQKFAPGAQAVLTIRFAALPGSGPVTTNLSFGDDPIERQLGDVEANAVTAAYSDLTITIDPEAVVSVSAASFREAAVASEAVAAAFGRDLATMTQAADTQPLPTSLGGTQVLVTDSAGIARSAPLFFVSPGQINYQIPPGTAIGAATVTVINGAGNRAVGSVQITQVAPGLFSANADGAGVVAAIAMRAQADGAVSYEAVAQLDEAQQRFVAAPLSLGPDTDQVYLMLFGTGLQHRSSLDNVKVIIGGEEAEVLYAGPQGGFVGLDQINVHVPRSLAGRGEVDVVLIVDGKTANTVRVAIH